MRRRSPTETSTTRSVAENTTASTNIGTAIAATDADSGDTLEYTLGGTDIKSFGIHLNTGQLQTSAALDFETKSSYAVTVSVSDGKSGTDSIGVTITVTDVDEQPATPGAPTVSATANSDTSLDVSWTAPGLNGGPAITGYDLQYRPGTSGSFTNGPQNVSGTSTAIAGLTAGTAYQVQVRALNGETPSDWSPSGHRQYEFGGGDRAGGASHADGDAGRRRGGADLDGARERRRGGHHAL